MLSDTDLKQGRTGGGFVWAPSLLKGERKRERGERERDRDRDRQTDRQTDRDRQGERRSREENFRGANCQI